MGIMIKASDLYYRYPKETTTRHHSQIQRQAGQQSV